MFHTSYSTNFGASATKMNHSTNEEETPDTNTAAVYYDYTQIHNIVCGMAPAVLSFDPTVILAIGGGGFIPARMLRPHLKDVPILAVTLEAYNDETNTLKNETKAVIHQWFDTSYGHGAKVKGGRVLIVDEIDDTRLTLNTCISKLREANPEAIAVAVLHNKQKSKKSDIPEDVLYIAGETIPDKWLYYPWDETKVVSSTS